MITDHDDSAHGDDAEATGVEEEARPAPLGAEGEGSSLVIGPGKPKFCAERHRPYRVVPDGDLEKLTESRHHEGVCLVARTPEPPRLEEILGGIGGLAWSAGVLARSNNRQIQNRKTQPDTGEQGRYPSH